MLAMQLQIGLGDAVRVGHVVVDARSRQTMRAAAVLLPSSRSRRRSARWRRGCPAASAPAPCSAASPALAWQAMAKAPLAGKPLSAALAFVKMIVPLAPLALGGFSRIRRAACWPTRKALNAELRSVSNAMAGSASVMALRKIPGTRPSMLCTTSVGAPRSRDDILEQPLDGGGIAGVACVAAHAVRLLQRLQHRLVRIAGGDGDAHAVLARTAWRSWR